MAYDPEACGAKCSICPLREMREGDPVAPEFNGGARILIIGETPEVDAVKTGVPFSGEGGKMLQRMMSQSGLTRGHAHWTHTLACRPVSKMETMTSKIQAHNREVKKRNAPIIEQNKQRKKLGMDPLPLEEPWPTPEACCRPRLVHDMRQARATNVMLVGNLAVKAMLGNQKVQDVRGGVREVWEADTPDGDVTHWDIPVGERDTAVPPVPEARRLKVMPLLSPGFVLHKPRWTKFLAGDVARAARFFQGIEDWTPPKVTYHPKPAEFRAFLARPEPFFSCDLETDGIEPLTARTRCIGVGTADGKEVMIAGILSKDGHGRFYNQADLREILAIWKEFCENENILKVGHNFGGYDRTVIQSDLKHDVKPTMDTLLLHRLVESELPHNLGFVGSVYAGAPSWKCYDGDTEVLTPNGWVRFSALQRGAKVAQWSRGDISFVEPQGYVDQPYAGPIWRLESQAADLLVTPDHKMVLKSKYSGQLVECAVQALPKSGSLPHAGVYGGEKEGPTAAYARFVVAIQADGSWVTRKDGHCIDFGFTKVRKIQRLRQILAELGVSFRETVTGSVNPRTRIWVDPCDWVDQAWAHLGATKTFGPWLFEWPLEIRQQFLDEVALWDGTKQTDHTHYDTTIEQNADWVQACAVISGRAARKYKYAYQPNVAPLYRVSLPSGVTRSRTWSKLEGMKKTEESYNGRIYCVSVPSGFILVRRNGKVTVSGNTDREGRKLATEAETDHELHAYCALDVSICAIAAWKLIEVTRLRAQDHLVPFDHAVQEVCTEMHTIGMYVDQKRRREHEVEQMRILVAQRRLIRDIVGSDAFNPASPVQVRDLLFEKWGLGPALDTLANPMDDKDRYNAAGDPSTNDVVLRGLTLAQGLTDQQAAFLKALRKYRKANKLLGTYILKLRYNTEEIDFDAEGYDEDEDKEEREERRKRGQSKCGIVDPYTNRMYPGYNPAVAVTGRLSSSKPINAQNFPSDIKDIIAAAPGHVLVGADADQLELRIAAALWGMDKYLQAFLENADPHSVTALMVFGEEFRTAEGFVPGIWKGDLFIPDTSIAGAKWGKEAKKRRDLAKRVQYASQYMAAVETVHKVITETEDKDGNLIYAALALADIRRMHAAWLAAASQGTPGIKKGWEREIMEWRRQGYLEEPINRRRRDFLDGENPNELVNFKVQCVPGHVRCITDAGYLPIRDLVGRKFKAWTGKGWAEATAIQKGYAALRMLRTNRGIDLPCDETHKVRVVARDKYEWRKVSDLTVGNRIAMDLAQPLEFGQTVDTEDAYILGLWLSDGSFSRKLGETSGGLSITVGNKAASGGGPARSGPDQLDRLSRWAASRGLNSSLRDGEGCKTFHVYRGAAEWLTSYGIDLDWKAHTKRVPDSIWQADLNARRAFLTGFLDGDGYQGPGGAVIINLCQLPLLEELWALARTVGIDGRIHGPYKADQKGHISYHLALNGSQIASRLGWGEACKLRTGPESRVPMFEIKRVVAEMDATSPKYTHKSKGREGWTCPTESHKVIRSRLRIAAGADNEDIGVGAYVLAEMGAKGLHDHAIVDSVGERSVQVPVYTLVVDDPEHSYVANGFISANSSGAALMMKSMLDVRAAIPMGVWGPHTGLITQTHDSNVLEVPIDKGEYAAAILQECMNLSHPALPGVRITAKADVGSNWKKV